MAGPKDSRGASIRNNSMTREERASRPSVMGKSSKWRMDQAVESEDGYIANQESRKRYEQLANQGLVDGVEGPGEWQGAEVTARDENGDVILDENGDPVKEPSWIEKKTGGLKTLNNIKTIAEDFANPTDEDGNPTDNWFTYTKKSIGTLADFNRMREAGVNPWAAGLAAIDERFPLGLSEACQAILDNFKSNLPPKQERYEKNKKGISSIVDSDEAQCAMDALEMLSGIKGLKNQIEATIYDIEAMANVIKGIVDTLFDYDFLNDLSEFKDLFDHLMSKTGMGKKAEKRAIAQSSPKIIEDGRVAFLEWLIMKIGIDEVLTSNPNFIADVLANYQKVDEGDDERLEAILAMADPNWMMKGSLHNMDIFQVVSSDAYAYLSQRRDFMSLMMAADVIGYPGSVFETIPTVGDVTHDLYPDAVFKYRPIITPSREKDKIVDRSLVNRDAQHASDYVTGDGFDAYDYIPRVNLGTSKKNMEKGVKKLIKL